MDAALGGRPVALGSAELGVLRDSSASRDDRDVLITRLRDDGYIRLRRFHPRPEVLAAREAVLAETNRDASSTTSVMNVEPLASLVAGRRTLSFFSWLLGGDAMTYDYRWVRVVGQGQRTAVHCDRVFMGRGTDRLVTCWTPLGDVPVTQGPIALWLGSDYHQRIVDTYGSHDVDRDLIDGYVAHDPWECVASMGGRWYSDDFEAGDLVIFGMHTLHGSLDNTTEALRVSCDTRYQQADEAIDDRWVGNPPKGHDRWITEPRESLEAGRHRWGLPALATTR